MTIKEKLEMAESMPVGASPKIDIRQWISDTLEANEIPRRRIAKYLGISPQNFSNFMNRRVPIRLDYLERLFWLLNFREDE